MWVPEINNGPMDYQARQHEIDFVLTPYTGSPNLSFTSAQKTLKLTYGNTTLMFEHNGKKTSGLDSTAVRAAQPGSQNNPFLDPQMPIVSTADNRLVLDVESLVGNQDGTCVFIIIISNIYTVLRSSSVAAFRSVTNTAHTSIGFRRLDNSFKLSNPSMLFYLRILLGRWILPRNPTQRLDVPRTKVTFSLSLFPRNSISPP
jgi:hypothetical protein